MLLYKMVSKSMLGLTNIERATSGAVEVDRCADEPLSDMIGFFWALNGGDKAEAEKLGVGVRNLAGGWVRGGVVQVAVGVGGHEIDVSFEAVTRDGDREIQEGEGNIGNGP
eukprot:g22383.t1